MQRRQVLQTSAATLGATVGLAGCLSGSSDDQQTRRPDTERSNDRSDGVEADAVETTPEDREETETPADLTAPPRESAVFAAVEASETRLRVTFESNPVVESLAETNTTTTASANRTATRTTTAANASRMTATTSETATANRTTESTTAASLGRFGDSLATLLPVGVAAGRPGRGGGGGGRSGGGRNGGSGSGSGGSGSGWGGSGGSKSGSGGSKSGKSGSGGSGGSKSGGGTGGSPKPSPGKRGSGDSPSRGRNGRYKWRGGSYAAWHDRHSNRVRNRDAVVARCGVGYLGDPEATDEDLPGAGPVEWTNQCDGDHDEMAVEPSDPGWYRVGARLRSPDRDRDFGWEAVDLKLLDGDDGWRIDSQWKVSPRL